MSFAFERRSACILPLLDAEPLVKWAGGKRRSAVAISLALPGLIEGAYMEPMVGGGALFWHLARAGALCGPVVLGDINPHLIAMYRGVQQDVRAVLALLTTLESRYRVDAEGTYKATVEQLNGLDGSAIRTQEPLVAALVLFLNRTCVNGLWRVNSRGKFNTSWCHDPDVRIVYTQRLLACARVLADVQIVNADYRALTGQARAGDVVYLDGPYLPTSSTADFTSYTAGGFTDADQQSLRDEVVRLRAAGVRVLASNADVPRARDLYAGLPMQQIWAPRSINSKVSGRGAVAELLIG